MNEGTKTGIFWVVAAASLAVGMFVAWPTSPTDGESDGFNIGGPLFAKFTDPSTAANLKIVTFDDERGQLDSFEVVRDAETGLWSIPSRDNYPADAIDHMREAANSLIGLKMLDVQTTNAEDHDDLGVAEPNIQDTKVGDEGVGRMVTFKDDASATLASLIIGDQVKDEPEKRYVRIPGQDPVYVVRLDVRPLTTNFQAWIERDLLRLSSIDISKIKIKDYTTAIAGEQMALSLNYDATLQIEDQDWKMLELLEYDPKNPVAEPTEVTVAADKKLNKVKLDQIKNALDDLRIANVVRKPDAMSKNLRDNQDLVSDPTAMGSLQMRGFYPGKKQGSEKIEIYAANGDMTVTLNDGVQYVMRFGNISGVGKKGDADPGKLNVETGVNRFFLVTTMVDESRFPAPDLKPVPQTLEELDELLNPKEEEKLETPDTDAGDKAEDAPKTEDASEDAEPATETPDDDGTDAETPDTKTTKAEAETEVTEGEAETEGGGEATGAGQAQAAEEADGDEELSEEERMELLEAEQEKITKENQRKMDARKDAMEVAERRVRALNERFADWYYVIPEDTYAKLRVDRDELFEKTAEERAAEVEAAMKAKLSPTISKPQQNPLVPSQPGATAPNQPQGN